MKNLEKSYNPAEFEDNIYKFWMDNEYFKPSTDDSKESFTIVMPPPNVTGKLHLGHALNGTLQDIVIRYKRMQGYNALWLPGTDHASISTEAKVVEKLRKEGVKKSDLTREEFLEEAWDWTHKYGGNIKEQLKKLGSSCDWSRDSFTLDEHLTKAVYEVFERLYKKDYIYRGMRIVNWCPHCHTAISDTEVVHEPQEGKMWYIKYPYSDKTGFVTIATTRPETLLGDLAVAVNPDDERYTDLVGKTLDLPLTDRQIPVIADEYVDSSFGTGCVKITPSHDPNDFEVGARHDLGQLIVIDEDAKMNDNAYAYKGLDRYEARERIIKDLDEQGLLVKVEKHENSVGHCERCNTIIEPLASLQWFVKMEEMAKRALEAYRDNKVNIIPERFGKIYENWLENIRDWCISRQLWWGHRIPVYYCDDCGEYIVSKERPEKCDKCGSTHLKQDEDTLDTWFSSALWPFSTLGWPDTDSDDYKRFFPTDLLVTGYDIIFFWVSRMIFSSLEQTGEVPFKDVLLTGLIRDVQGRKMSKSLGNGIDPLQVISEYGADALRYSLITNNAPGNDIKYSVKKVEPQRNFANKLWNASRFVLMNLDDRDDYSIDYDKLEREDKWIISRLKTVVDEINNNLDKYEIGIAAAKVQDFIWEDFCDWYIELVKTRLYDRENINAQNVILYILENILKILHPFMPFITEEIWSYLPNRKTPLIISDWPKDIKYYEEELNDLELIKSAIKAIRKMKTDMNIEPSKHFSMLVYPNDEAAGKLYTDSANYFKDLEHIDKITVLDNKDAINKDFTSIMMTNAELFFPLNELIDFEKEKQRLMEEKEKLDFEVERLEKKLSNEKFVSKAPKDVVDKEREKLDNYKELLDKTLTRLEELK